MSLRLRTLVSLIGCLILLQGVDFLLTALLLGRGDVYEANPLAREILLSAGWGGLAVFKVLITVLALAAALGVASRRPAAGLRLLVVMCLLMAGVNVYSGTLLAREPESEEMQSRRVDRENAKVRADLVALQEFMNSRRTLCDEWLAGRVTLPEAIGELAVLLDEVKEKVRRPMSWLPKSDQPDQLAVFLYVNARTRRPYADSRVMEIWQEVTEVHPEAAQQILAKLPHMAPRSGATLSANH